MSERVDLACTICSEEMRRLLTDGALDRALESARR